MRLLGCLYSKGLAPKSLGQLEGGGMGGVCVQVEEQAVEGSCPSWNSVVRQVCKGETAPC